MSPPLFHCGHPRTAENTWGHGGNRRCRICKRARKVADRATSSKAERHLEHRIRYLPIALERARAKLRELELEARTLGLVDLIEEPRHLTGDQILTNPTHVDLAWEREAEIARIQARL